MAKVIRKINAETEKQLRILVTGFDNLQGQTGWFESSKYEDGTPVAYVAAIQEFGVPEKNIPPRSFMRTTIKEKTQIWLGLIKQALTAKLDPRIIMQKISKKAEDDIRVKIASITAPKLADATIKARQGRNASGQASEKPLIDSQIMITTLTSQVVKK